MKKSNWLILGILVVASIFFLWLWYYLSFNLIDNPRDLVLTIAWWAVVLVACVGIHEAEKKRQERIRTMFVAEDGLFNSEVGIVENGGNTTVQTIENTLANLEYNFHTEDFPKRGKYVYDYIVHSEKFDFDKKDDQIEVKEWEGDVVEVRHPKDDPKKFSNKEELCRILGETPAVVA